MLFCILEVENKPVGQIRLSPEESGLSISYSVALDQRGKGYGAKLLWLMENQVALSKGEHILIGEVKKDNIGSQKAFERLGYIRKDEGDFFKYKKVVGK